MVDLWGSLPSWWCGWFRVMLWSYSRIWMWHPRQVNVSQKERFCVQLCSIDFLFNLSFLAISHDSEIDAVFFYYKNIYHLPDNVPHDRVALEYTCVFEDIAWFLTENTRVSTFFLQVIYIIKHVNSIIFKYTCAQVCIIVQIHTYINFMHT